MGTEITEISILPGSLQILLLLCMRLSIQKERCLLVKIVITIKIIIIIFSEPEIATHKEWFRVVPVYKIYIQGIKIRSKQSKNLKRCKTLQII